MKAVRFTMHIFAGLALGMALYAVHLYMIALNLQGKPTAATFRLVAVGLGWIVISVVYMLFRGWKSPIVTSDFWTGMLIFLILLISVIVWLVLFFAICFAGSIY